MNLFKKTMVAVLVSSLAVSTVACSSDKKDASNNTTTTNKTEYITDINKDNVEGIVVEYKQLLSYYNDLKTNLKTISDVSKNSNLESDLSTAKDSIKNNSALVKDSKVKYKPLADAQKNLLKMHELSLKMTETVVKDKNAYNKTVDEYNTVFKEFKNQMDQIRKDIEKVKDQSKDKKDTENQNSNNDNTKSEESSNTKSEDKKTSKESSDTDSRSESPKAQKIAKESGSTTVPYVSSLTSELEKQIAAAGSEQGESFKSSGGTKEQAKAKAEQMFDDIENDNPIQRSERSQAKEIFINAFMQAFN